MPKDLDQSSNDFENLDNSESLQEASSKHNIGKSRYGKALLKNDHDEIWIPHLNLEEDKILSFSRNLCKTMRIDMLLVGGF